jgi:hypothetical protein
VRDDESGTKCLLLRAEEPTRQGDGEEIQMKKAKA